LEDGEEKRRERKDRGLKICFWNIAGAAGKCEEVWKYLEEFDVIGLTETWVEDTTWKKLNKNLSNKYNWYQIAAVKEGKKGRAKSGIIMATDKKLECRQE